jgi:hypothetical protein
MLQKCANPGCAAPFRHRSSGKFYRVRIDQEGDIQILAVSSHHALRPDYFWLCRRCSTTVSIKFDHAEGLVVAPILRRAAATG